MRCLVDLKLSTATRLTHIKGNTGLGKEAVFQLAKHNPSRIYLASRNASKGQDAIADIQKQLTSPVDIRYLPLDLSSFASIRAAATHFTTDAKAMLAAFEAP